MNAHRKPALWLLLAITLLLVTACRSEGTLSEEDRIATRVAEDQAVAATLTASAATPTEEAADPTETPVAVAQATEEPTETPIPPTDTPVVVDSGPIAANGEEGGATDDSPTPTSEFVVTSDDDVNIVDATVAPEPTATPEPTPVILGFSPVDGNDGNDNIRSSIDENEGRVVLLPGFAAEEISEPMVFRDRIVLRVEIFDARYGQTDGAGITSVTYNVEDVDGNVVYEKREETAAYCLFGGNESLCDGLNFEQAGFQWPGGEEIVNGEHLARIDIVPQNGEVTQWRWRFDVEIPGREALAEPISVEPDTARITGIIESQGRYVVAFEAFEFEPTLPGQHLHFFWSTVSPEQAGVPGSGPWQLYPASAGESGASPFTLFNVADRPTGAEQICVLVANPDHSVIQRTGNCFDLP